MENPFIQLDQRLSAMERTLKEISQRVQPIPAPVKFREGGLALAMEVCNYSKSSIYKLVMKNAIPHKKRGSRIWFSEEDLINWMDRGMPTDWETKVTTKKIA